MDGEDVELELPWKATLDDEAFASMDYATHPTSCAADSNSNQRRHEKPPILRPRPSAITTTRFKRKSFSKQLQLLCLQRYAEYANNHGRIPDKQKTEQLLHQSYVQFLKEGGERDECRLTYADFLKLVRNRRSEINARAQRPKGNGEAFKQAVVLTPAKKKLQEERDKIREYIGMIDRTREQARLVPDPQQHLNYSALVDKSTQAMTVEKSGEESSSSTLSDPMEQLEAILRIQQETQNIQREIAARLESVSRAMRHHESQVEFEEPSCVSV
ncbi:uncharacterized protein PHALS_06569 [Plasmopara halstedii]|uniref:Uncharacterized protein n=1 Tax=Plasmopara halstedii TaxID=4781 RepID=A0A0P1B3D2_PLAHL|nr:uncharacterized protein PHALS_06569 [Plasmopara halstedii]CEG48764.1 hypothetical protein PHALS_06569 [Plasmopara halstedii]|eukprot:XP_024585133.1 hypothetical protein PHALS_06569 [Plasmopara halstedii]